MALLKVLEFPDARLRTKASPVTEFGPPLSGLVRDMFETMYAAPGIGLAATQVDVHQRLLVLDVSKNRDEPRVFVNPQFTLLDQECAENDEGCLSVPGFYESVVRPQNISVTAQNEHGEGFNLEAHGLMAVCIQHEIDHLNGKLFVDYLSSLKRQRIRQKLKKQRKLDA